VESGLFGVFLFVAVFQVLDELDVPVDEGEVVAALVENTAGVIMEVRILVLERASRISFS